MMLKLASAVSILRIADSTVSFGRMLVTETRKIPVFPAFVKLHFSEVKTKHPELKSTEIMKKLGEMYKATPPSELQKLSCCMPPVQPTSEQEKQENRKKLTLARKHGFPRPLPVTGYQVYIHEQLTGNKGASLKAMTSKLEDASRNWKSLSDRSKEQYVTQAMENKLSYLRNLKTWSVEHGIPFSKRTSILLNRFYVKHQKGLISGTKATPKEVSSK